MRKTGSGTTHSSDAMHRIDHSTNPRHAIDPLNWPVIFAVIALMTLGWLTAGGCRTGSGGATPIPPGDIWWTDEWPAPAWPAPEREIQP